MQPLDPVGERQIFELLATFAKEKIILFTTHRYDTIRKADTIVVLVDGHIAEMRTHEELARNTREFWSLYLAQGSLPGSLHSDVQQINQPQLNNQKEA
jgi:ABC-type multidrug transport system fused ATPase/permease subunit